MSYEVLFIAKGGVTIDIPLWDCSSILVTLRPLYDYYIQLSTLELPLEKTLHYNARAHVRQNGLSKPSKTSLTLKPLWWDQLYDILVMVEGGELMPSLVICDSVCALNGDILLKRTLAFVARMASLPNTSTSMRMVVLGVNRPATCWCIVSTLLSKHVLVVACISLSKNMFNSNWTCSYLYLSECAKCTGLHACAQWHACCWIPLQAIHNIAHLVYFVLATGMDL